MKKVIISLIIAIFFLSSCSNLSDGPKKTYYGMDSLMLSSSMEEFVSTILWIPQLHIHQNIINKHSFYTSDIPGKFRIVVQGVTENGEPLFAEKTIEVVK